MSRPKRLIPPPVPGSKSPRVKDYLKHIARRNPVEELVLLADEAYKAGDFKTSVRVWDILQSYVEPRKKPIDDVPPKIVTKMKQESAAITASHLLNELEQENAPPPKPPEFKINADGTVERVKSPEEEDSHTLSMAGGETPVQTETSPEADVQGHTGEQGTTVCLELLEETRQDDDNGGDSP